MHFKDFLGIEEFAAHITEIDPEGFALIFQICRTIFNSRCSRTFLFHILLM